MLFVIRSDTEISLLLRYTSAQRFAACFFTFLGLFNGMKYMVGMSGKSNTECDIITERFCLIWDEFAV